MRGGVNDSAHAGSISGLWSAGGRCVRVIITSYYLQTSNTLRSVRAIITLPAFGCSSRRPRSRK